MRVIMSTSALRSHHFEKHLLWEQMLIPVVEGRLGRPRGARALHAQTAAHMALACLDVAFAQWVADGGESSLATLLDDVFAYTASLQP